MTKPKAPVPLCACGMTATIVVVSTGRQTCGLCAPRRGRIRLLMVGEPPQPEDSS